MTEGSGCLGKCRNYTVLMNKAVQCDEDGEGGSAVASLEGVNGSLAALGRESGSATSNLSAGDSESTADLSLCTLTTLRRGEVAGWGGKEELALDMIVICIYRKLEFVCSGTELAKGYVGFQVWGRNLTFLKK